MARRSIITIGNFDGVHVGHAALVRRARELAAGTGGPGAGLNAGGTPRVVAMAFDPHPFTRLRPELAPPRLTVWERRVELLGELGADEVVRLEPTDELLGKTPREFTEWLLRDFAPAAVVEGPDFHFGRARSGNMQTLEELGRELGFAVETVAPVEVMLSDASVVRASSSVARWLIEHGRVTDAARVLGRPYEVEGVVEPGDRRGRTIGFPSANIRTECMLPADGVYAGVGVLGDGRRMTAAISVGTKPTFGEHRRIIEAFLLDRGQEVAHGGNHWEPLPGLPEYGWPLRLEVRHWLRDQARYGTLEALVEQMLRDCRRTRELIEGPASTSRGLAACP
jgi:riboflavin kinase / FMN adenylyltransferase